MIKDQFVRKCLTAFCVIGAAMAAPIGTAVAESPAPPVQTDAAIPAHLLADENVKDAVAFVRVLSDASTAALSNEDKEEEARIADFQKILGDGLALKAIGKRMISAHADEMSDAQRARYDEIFPHYLTRLYAEQFKTVINKPLTIADAKKARRDVYVRTQFARNDGKTISVDWRVRALKDGGHKALDIIVNGVSIMLVKRDEFSSYITANGIDAFLDRLEKDADL